MRHKWLFAITITAALSQMPFSAEAFECPKHIAKAQVAIDKANDSFKEMNEGRMPLFGLAHLRNARHSISEAEYHHGESGDLHHARSIIRAGEAQSHALVAYLVLRGSSSE
jgi:hypothetical protein